MNIGEDYKIKIRYPSGETHEFVLYAHNVDVHLDILRLAGLEILSCVVVV